MSTSSSQAQRVLTVVAATLIALACGTNYAYSAWAPQFAARMKLSSTESNIIGTGGNLGMYASGIPVGLLIDAKGPRPGALIGVVSLAAGYFPIQWAYTAGPGSMAVPFLFFFSFLTGLGSCSAFSASIKTAAINFPDHRGTATAFPLAAFGLSAFFYSTISAVAFKDDTGSFLLVLAIGTSAIILVSTFFIRLLPRASPYSSLPTHEHPSGSSPLLRTKSRESSEIGRQHETSNSPEPHNFASASIIVQPEAAVPNLDADETSSLVAKSKSSTESDNSFSAEEMASPDVIHHSHHADIRGLAMLPTVEFWQLWLLLGILTGIGLMTINNIGNDAKALWRYYDDSAGPDFIQKRQVMHVSTLSIMSCTGRLLSGIGSDLLVKKLHMSRLWCIFASAVVFCGAQLAATQISNPDHLIIVSGFTGLAYGFLFGVFPSLVVSAFGVAGISQNWGYMCIAPVISGNIFNLLYGTIYDHHSMVSPNGERDCREGIKCYRTAYFVTFYAGIAGALVTLWSIWYERRVHGHRRTSKTAHERMA